MQPPAAASVRADRMWFRRSLRVSMVPKYLFIPLPDEISELFPVFFPPLRDGRSYCGGGGERVKLMDGLRVRIMAHSLRSEHSGCSSSQQKATAGV